MCKGIMHFNPWLNINLHDVNIQLKQTSLDTRPHLNQCILFTYQRNSPCDLVIVGHLERSKSSRKYRTPRQNTRQDEEAAHIIASSVHHLNYMMRLIRNLPIHIHNVSQWKIRNKQNLQRIDAQI